VSMNAIEEKLSSSAPARRRQKPRIDTSRLMEKVARRDAEGPLKFFLDWLYDQGLGSEQLIDRSMGLVVLQGTTI
jgi:hypothetical protein